MTRPYELEIVADERRGEGGFFRLRCMRLRNRHPDGSVSREYQSDYVERPKGLDAVVLALYREVGGAVEVLLRAGLRPPLIHGRPSSEAPLPDTREYFLFTEVVAGILERGEIGEDAIRRRAVDEAWEEAGAVIEPAAIEMLGGTFPSPGMSPEKFWLTAARVDADVNLSPPSGDGSPMEEGATVRWVELSRAIAMCAASEIEDAKTEIVLRRLRDRLDGVTSRRGT